MATEPMSAGRRSTLHLLYRRIILLLLLLPFPRVIHRRHRVVLHRHKADLHRRPWRLFLLPALLRRRLVLLLQLLLLHLQTMLLHFQLVPLRLQSPSRKACHRLLHRRKIGLSMTTITSGVVVPILLGIGMMTAGMTGEVDSW